MTLRARNLLYTFLLLTAIFFVWRFRQSAPRIIRVEGNTMGTTYHISYYDKQNRDIKSSVDSLLLVFNQSVSTYIPGSEISSFNKGKSLHFADPYFYPILKKSAEVTKASDGAFDPTVMPLVNAWGFGPQKPLNPDRAQVDSIKDFVGFALLSFDADSVWKKDKRVQLDFSALAKGYGVDLVADLIGDYGIEDFLVEIGGEVMSRGSNLETGSPWTVGILDPDSSPSRISYIAEISPGNKAVATSGNYFNYRVVNGRKFSHEIDPKSGYPIQRTILSASVVASDCMTADAWATAFMVMGFDSAVEILKTQPTLSVLFVHSTPGGNSIFVSDTLKPLVQVNQKTP